MEKKHVTNKATHTTVLILAILILLTAITFAEEPGFLQRNQGGIRLGAWVNQGDDPPEDGFLLIDGDSTGSFETHIGSGSFYFEAYYAHRLNRSFMAEISLGVANRGSVTITEEGSTDIGNLMLYSFQTGIKFYPAIFGDNGWYPHFSAAMVVNHGRRDVQFTNSSYYNANWEEESAWDLNYAFGVGLDIPVATNIGLDFGIKYVPVSFSEPLVTIKDYSAITITVGVKYLSASK